MVGEDIPLWDNSGRLQSVRGRVRGRARGPLHVLLLPHGLPAPAASSSLHVEISGLLVISNSTFCFYLPPSWRLGGQTGVCVSVVRNSHSRVWKCWERTVKSVNDWLRSLWVLRHFFSCCCTVERSWIYCIFFFFEARLGLLLLQYCDDFMKIVNCTEFTSRICSFEVWFHIKICIFFPQTGRSSCTAPTFCPLATFFLELWLRVILQL